MVRPAPRFPGSLRDVHQRTVNKGHSILAGRLRPRALVAVLLAAARIELTKGRTSSGCRSPDRDRLPTPRLRERRNQQHRLRDAPECLCEALLDQRGLRAGGVRGRGSSQCQQPCSPGRSRYPPKYSGQRVRIRCCPPQSTALHRTFSLTDLDTIAPEVDDACRAVVHSTEGVALRGMPASSGRVLRNLPTGLHARGTRD